MPGLRHQAPKVCVGLAVQGQFSSKTVPPFAELFLIRVSSLLHPFAGKMDTFISGKDKK
jgi:hypothetical protein